MVSFFMSFLLYWPAVNDAGFAASPWIAHFGEAARFSLLGVCHDSWLNTIALFHLLHLGSEMMCQAPPLFQPFPLMGPFHEPEEPQDSCTLRLFTQARILLFLQWLENATESLVSSILE
jgi:hypothetical protein